MGFRLTISAGQDAGKAFSFEQESVVIGRTPDCDVVLLDPGVSRKHARIFSQGAAFFVEDMGSSNGTKVNGAAVKKSKLTEGDSLTLGPVVFDFSAKEIESLHTRIVDAEMLKKGKGKVALGPPGASTSEIQAIGRSNTTAMPAIKDRSTRPFNGVPAHSGPVGVPPRPPRTASAGLSAADRARIRHQSKGAIGEAKIRWLEMGDSTRQAVMLGAGLVVAGVVAWGLFSFLHEGRSGPGHPEPTALSREPIEDSFGLGEGVTWSRPDKKEFTFEFNSPVRAVVILHYQAKDISSGEVELAVNGASVGDVPADTLNASDRTLEVLIPAQVLKKGEPNRLLFDNVKNPPGDDPWRIWNLWVETFPLPELPPPQLLTLASDAFRNAELAFERKDIGAINRYEAWKQFRNAWLMLEAYPDPKPPLYALARDRVKEAQQELDRWCGKLLLEEERAFNQKDFAQARATLDHVKDFFPGKDQPCTYRAEQKRAEHGL